MNQSQKKIVAEAKKVVKEIIEGRVAPTFSFHNIAHTRDVAKSAKVIQGHYGLNDEERFIVFIAAWFHDTGFSAGCAEGHEEESIKLAAEFLRRHNIESEIIERVSSCIHATRIPQAPLTIEEKIICDADLYHLGTRKFETWSARLREELQKSNKKDTTDEEWRQGEIELLMSHSYHTSYCQQKLERVKKRWIEELQNKQ